MEFGIALPTAADDWKVVQRAEALGFTHAWFYDTQMLSADCFVAMGAAAVKTSRIRLGTGVLVPSNRIAPVSANAFATLNALAPGRIDFGVGTGFTARRAMGMGAIRLAEMERYIETVYGLLGGETVEAAFEGRSHKIRFLNPELGLTNLRDPVRLHVSAYGPRSRALVARLGAGWLNFIGDEATATATLDQMRGSWQSAGRDAAELGATGFLLGCVLRDGETLDSDRVMAQSGPRAAVLLHRAADADLAGLPNTSAIPDAVRAEVDAYVALARGFEPADARYLQNHRGHLMAVKDEERRFISPELIRATTFTGSEDELCARFETLRDAGYTQLTIQLVPGQQDAIEDWARIVKRFADC
ncbi:MAG: LLM class flavin-dependent oxidoreductase [Gammaproteobacteria bacterium]|nr:LLM class flavin-dependent oxidoreductase [Gammaproteobacteria bacterium]